MVAMNTVSSQLEALVGSLQNSKELKDGTVRSLLTSLQSLLVTDGTSGDQKDRIAQLIYTVIVRYQSAMWMLLIIKDSGSKLRKH